MWTVLDTVVGRLAPVTDTTAEPPALIALLVQPPRRVAAVGGVLVMDEGAGTIRAPRAHPTDLMPFEKHVFDVVTARAGADGAAVPIEAIDLGP